MDMKEKQPDTAAELSIDQFSSELMLISTLKRGHKACQTTNLVVAVWMKEKAAVEKDTEKMNELSVRVEANNMDQ